MKDEEGFCCYGVMFGFGVRISASLRPSYHFLSFAVGFYIKASAGARFPYLHRSGAAEGDLLLHALPHQLKGQRRGFWDGGQQHVHVRGGT